MIKKQKVIRLPVSTTLRRRLKRKLLQWYEENSKGNPKGILAHEICAIGIIQAMQHFKLNPNIFPRDCWAQKWPLFDHPYPPLFALSYPIDHAKQMFSLTLLLKSPRYHWLLSYFINV